MSEQIDRPGISDMEFTITMDRDWFCGGVVNNKWYHKLLRLLSMGLLCPKKYQILLDTPLPKDRGILKDKT